MGDNEVRCRAWRIIAKYGTDVDDIIIAEIENSTEQDDIDGAECRRRIITALDDLR